MILVSKDKNLDEAEFEFKKALVLNANAKIVKKGNLYCTILFGYNNKLEASKMLLVAKQKLNKTSYIVKNNDNW